MMVPENKSVAVVVPAFNASATLPELLERLSAVVPLSAVIVVDDGSSDATASIARERGATVLRHERNRGKGAALRTGFRYVGGNPGTHSVITLDADLQHRPEDIPRLMEVRQREGAALVIGVRQRSGTSMPLARRLSNFLTSLLVSARTGKRVLDSQCGFRLIGREVLDRVSFRRDGFEAETEFLIKALRQGFSFRFVAIPTIYLPYGSHMTNWETTRRFLQVLMGDL